MTIAVKKSSFMEFLFPRQRAPKVNKPAPFEEDEAYNDFTNAVFEYISDEVITPKQIEDFGEQIDRILNSMYQYYRLDREGTVLVPIENYAVQLVRQFYFDYFLQVKQLPTLPHIHRNEVFFTQDSRTGITLNYRVLSVCSHQHYVNLVLTAESVIALRNAGQTGYANTIEYLNYTRPEIYAKLTPVK